MPQQSRKKKVTKDETKKVDLKMQLKEKLKEKQLGRLAVSARENKLEKLQEKLKNIKDDSEKLKLENKIELIKRVNDNDNEKSSFTGEFPQY
jgi:hypothetical protein